MPVPRHSRATGDKTLAAHRAALPLIQTAKRGRPPVGYPRDTTDAGRIVRSAIPACVLRIVFPSLYGTAPRFSFHRSNGNLNDTTILNSYFSILNCSVRHPSAASAARAICLPIPAEDALPRLEGRASRQSERIQFEECQSSPVSETDRAGSFCIPARLHFPRSCDIITQKTEREASPCAVSAPQRRS